MRIEVDRELCSGHARCQIHGPDVYVLDDLGYNTTALREVPRELWEQARRGALACPEGAIVIEETGPDGEGCAQPAGT